MKKWNSHFIKTFFFLLLTIPAIGQKETFDIATYTPPRDWKKVADNGVISYSHINTTTGGFCVLAMYPSSTSQGDALKDFKIEWKDRVVTPLTAEPDPKTDLQTSGDGWKAVAAAAPIKINNIDAYAILTVFSGFGKRFSILTTLNDQSYLGLVDSLIGDIKLDKTVKNSVPPSSNTNLSITGTWSDYSGALGSYVNSSGGFIASADVHELHQYVFNDDKTFGYKEIISTNNITLYTETSGTYSINGDNLALAIKFYSSRMGVAGPMKEDKTKEKAEVYKFYIGANKWEAGPFLNLHKDGNYYPWSDFPYDYYKKVSGGSKTQTKDLPVNNKTSMNETTGLQTNGSSGTTGKFGSAVYNIPIGWNVTKYPDGDILVPVDLPKDEVLQIWVQQSMSFSGTMEQGLQKSFDETVAQIQATRMNDVNGGNYSKQIAKISFQGWEYIRCSGGIHMGGGDYPPEFGLDLFVIKINNRFERISVLKSRKSCNMARFYADERAKYYDAINNFLFSLRFTDGPVPLLQTGVANGGGITGVWQGISMSVGTPSVGQPLGVGYKVFSPIFLSNGQAYFGPKFSSEGLYELDPRIPAELYRRDWGTYTFSNGKGILRMPYGDIPMRMQGTSLIITPNGTDHKFYHLSPVDGARFNGTYIMSEAYGKIPSISFTADGKFTDNGVVRVLCHEYTDCINPGLAPGSGTYLVKDFTIIFHYSDGRIIKIAFMGTEYDISNQSPAKLVLSSNEDPLYKK